MKKKISSEMKVALRYKLFALFTLFMLLRGGGGGEGVETYRMSQKNAPIKQTKMAKHGRLVNIPKWSKGVQKGLKW